ncbi:venom allergen 5-like [Scaptodrosophila lebanonensis]|uniref:Venom allergen 5-like n=1 Tax=Drosophila lebanonensis TaxID=7225 RepID=A0A6J2TC81_DROLE|nr:venom allergen 5-like [Scaptodrosophila lebanonensis]
MKQLKYLLLLLAIGLPVSLANKSTEASTRQPSKWLLTGSNNPHCEPLLCPKGKRHVACEKYPNEFHKSCTPEQTRLANLTEFADKILKAHNERRNRVANGKNTSLPRAARLVAMRWSEELAMLASYNVRVCQAKHDDCRNTHNFTQSGQNIIVFNMTRHIDDEMLTKLLPELIAIGVRTWWSEHNNMSMSYLEAYPCDKKKQQIYRHFAVMALESNSHVGCAAVRYITKGITFLKITCNYAKDFVCEQPIYHLRAVNCATGPNRKYKALCSVRETFD